MTIKEVSQKYNISQDTLRYYERVGLIPTVARTSGGIRNYTENDLGWVENAICMRNAGVPIEALIEYVKLYQEGDETCEARRQLLQKQLDALAAQHPEVCQRKARGETGGVTYQVRGAALAIQPVRVS